jgi:hypothetical protein
MHNAADSSVFTYPVFTLNSVFSVIAAKPSLPQWPIFARTFPRLCVSVYFSLVTVVCPAQTLLDKSTAALFTLPVITHISPSPQQQNVRVDSRIDATFDRPIASGTGHFLLSNGQDDNRVISVLDGNQVYITNYNAVLISLSKPLLPDTDYWVSMEDATLTDALGNALPGVDTRNALRFRTAPEPPADTTPPVALGSVPTNGANEFDPNASWKQASFFDKASVAPYTEISANFNELIDVGGGMLVLSNGNGDTRTIDVQDRQHVQITSLSRAPFGRDPKTVLNITLTPPLEYNSTYTLRADQGVVTDLAGNALPLNPNTPALTFHTQQDVTPPILSSSAANVGYATLTFNEAVKLGSGTITLIDAQGAKCNFAIHDTRLVQLDAKSSHHAVILSPIDNLVAGATYSLVMPQWDGLLPPIGI